MNERANTSTLKRPPLSLLQSARIDRQMHRDTIRLYLENGWSLAVCCCDCPRIAEWTPANLLERFGGRLDTTIAELSSRVTCSGAPGRPCKSKDVALFPHPYDHPWTWPPAER